MKILKCIIVLFTILMTHPVFSADGSLYEMTAHLTDQDGKKVGLDIFAGHPVIVSMFYASCNYTCPILIEALKNLDAKLSPQMRKDVRFLLISFDPINDTPAVLKKLSIDSKVDLARWKFTAPGKNEVRELAALINVTYRSLPEGGFNHTSSMTLLDQFGSVVAQEEGPLQAGDAITNHLKKMFNTHKKGAL